MANRHALVVTASLTCAVILPACYTPVRYRVLTFFFDGVPEPGTAVTVGYAPPTKARKEEPGTPPKLQAAARDVFAHPPYRDGRCGSCHNIRTGQLYRTPQEGLCQGCHTDIPGQAKYVHGPVALSYCLFCHHHHTSAYPKVLHGDVTATCFRCHQREDLTEGPHHETIGTQQCTVCHNPHGGADRFFLKRDEP